MLIKIVLVTNSFESNVISIKHLDCSKFFCVSNFTCVIPLLIVDILLWYKRNLICQVKGLVVQ